MKVIPLSTKSFKTLFLTAFSFISVITAANTFASEPTGSGAGQACGTLKSFQGDVQVFDSTRTHLGDAKFGTILKCGDWVSVDTGKAVIENNFGASVLAAGGTFLQILDPQSGENPEHSHFTLYRGEFYLQAESQIRVTTPNSVANVMKGGAFILYSTSADSTQIVGLGAKASLENRFFSDQSVSANFAKVVSFSDPVERITPDAARSVNAKELNERLSKLGAKPELLASIEKAVKLDVKTKMPVSLAPTQLEIAARGELGSRSPASVSLQSVTASKKVLSQKTAKHAVRIESGPDFALKRAASDQFEKKKLLQSLSAVRPDEE